MQTYWPDVPAEIRKLQWTLGRFLPERDITCRTKNGLLTFNSQDGVIARRLYARRQWSWNMLQRCQQLLLERGLLRAEGNGTLINVGANIGSVLIPLMQDLRFRQALAFEPSQRNFGYLQINTSQNDLLDQVQLFPLGLSDANRTAEFELSPRNSGDHRVRENAADATRKSCYGELDREVVSVQLRTLDSVVAEEGIEIGPHSLIWVDIQGHEGRFLSGAQQTIGQGLPVITEFWPYGINRSGMSRTEYCDIANDLFDGFYEYQRGKWHYRVIAELAELYAAYDGSRSSTDLVLVSDR